MRFGPIRARLVRPEVAERVIIPAYDTMTPQERKELLAAEPLSFLHALRSPDEYPPDVPFPRVLEDSRAGLARLLAADAFGPVDSAAVFVYRLADGEHVQTGVVGGIDVADAAEGRILPHETTVVEREERLAAYLERVGAASSPVVLAARFPTELRRLVAEATDATPAVSARAADGVRQTVWAPPAELRERIVAALGEVERAYLVDGHHRIAAATRVAAADPSRRRFLAAVFPLDELRNLAHHRALLSLGSSRSDELVAELERRFDAVGVDDVGAAVPGRPGEVGVVTRAGMCRFALPTGTGTDPERLARAVLADVVGIEDERTDPRVVHVPGVVAPDELAAAVAEGRLAAVFLLHPLPLEAFVEAAEAGRRLPPKSTWFSPKPRSGLFLAD